MAKRARKIGYIGLAALVGLTAALLIAPNFIDWNQYRDRVAALASQQAGVDVLINGELSARILPYPSLSVKDLVLRAPGGEGADEIASLEGLDIDLSIGSLLGQDLHATKLTLNGPQLTVRERSTGQWSLKGWPELSSTNNEEGEAPAVPSNIELNALAIKRGKLVVERIEGPLLTLDNFNMSASGALPSGLFVFAGDSQVNGEAFGYEGRWQQDPSRGTFNSRLLITIGNNRIDLSGGQTSEAGLAGRIKATGNNISEVANFIGKIGFFDGTLVGLDQDFDFDISVEETGSRIKLASRQFRLGRSTGDLEFLGSLKPAGYSAATINVRQLYLDDFEALEIVGADTQASSQGGAPFRADIDLKAAAVHWNDQTVQQVDIVFSSGKAGMEITKAQAILPGGGTVAASGKLKRGEGSASINVEGGDARPLLAWLGVPVERFSKDRMKTLQLDLGYTQTADEWSLTTKKAKLDASNISATISQRNGGPIAVDAYVDQLNLDAYVMTPQANAGKLPKSSTIPDLNFNVRLDQITAGERSLGPVAAEGSVAGETITVTSLTASDIGGGALDVSGSVADMITAPKFDLEGSLVGFSGQLLATSLGYAIGDLPTPLQGNHSANFSATGTGDTIILDISDSFDETGLLTARGQLTALSSKAIGFDLEGRLKHGSTRPWAAAAGIALVRQAGAIDLAWTLKGSGSDNPVTVSLNGQMADGDMQLALVSDQQGMAGDITYDRPTGRLLSQALTYTFGNRWLDSPLSTKGSFSLGPDRWQFSDLNVKMGNMAVTGSLASNAQQFVTGDFTITGLAFGADSGTKKARSAPIGDWAETPLDLDEIADMTGEITLNINASEIYGQSLDGAKLAANFGAGQVTASLAGAQLNGQPLTLEAEATVTNALEFKVRSSVSRLVLDSFADSFAGVKPISGDAAIEIELASKGRTQKQLVRNLDGIIVGQANAGSLNFVSVLQMVGQLKSATSGRAIVSGLGQSLRGGVTTASQMNADIVVSKGIARLQPFVAVGDWGQLDLSGDTNLMNMVTDLSGQLAVTDPPDTPPIPVSFKGKLNDISGDWKTRTVQNFFLSGLQRKIRSGLLQDAKDKEADGEQATSPAEDVISGVLGLLKKKKKEEDK